ncbi:MAG: hypothetical protein HWN67_09060 [Candidatus Helarchaeota archaeon]|nr:hypothetical protein [Candidatus Helarchaeota archaeon]
MSLENIKIADRIILLGKKINMDIDKTLLEASKKYGLDLTKSVLNYSGSLVKEKIDEIINEEAEKFKYIRILVDFGVCEAEFTTILSVAKIIKDDLATELPTGSDISNLSITTNDSMKLIIIQFPAAWGVELVDEYRRNFIERLRQNDIVKT